MNFDLQEEKRSVERWLLLQKFSKCSVFLLHLVPCGEGKEISSFKSKAYKEGRPPIIFQTISGEKNRRREVGLVFHFSEIFRSMSLKNTPRWGSREKLQGLLLFFFLHPPSPKEI